MAGAASSPAKLHRSLVEAQAEVRLFSLLLPARFFPSFLPCVQQRSPTLRLPIYPPDDACVIESLFLLTTRPQLAQTRSIFAASRLRSVLRSRRALSLQDAWTAWSDVARTATAAARTEPLIKELDVLRLQVRSQNERSDEIQELRRQIAEARRAGDLLNKEQEEANNALRVQASELQYALQKSLAEAAGLRREEAQLRQELGISATDLREGCLLYTSPSPRDRTRSRMPSSA